LAKKPGQIANFGKTAWMPDRSPKRGHVQGNSGLMVTLARI